MSALDLARWQFGITTVYHFIFVPITIGSGFLVALTIAWHLNQFPTSIPIPGASKAASILDSLSGASIELSAQEIAELNASCPADGPIQSELVDQPPFRD